ncbi:hypothetical protein [Clostridium magnum]|uniref:Uncharacterized protein n=1 Tax=Clostridium magnum DSM 2767 TaxID=1121326 RepID=A0A162QMX4_9CLOT|nr:hypothetical protein [Clostridium magnum]KZL88731.1 hypothetical protein CLMAG_60200 [Clostridium magnum DSM 2767]SHJ65806.1 hypothetical protein SAMN02745944_06299 [Clostridium magnum DSM 2767]
MGNPKKLNLDYEKLCEIAKALNENMLANRSRSKENKISNDHFIRQRFDISRKDFSFTIKGTGIKYNQTTFMYDIANYNSITKVMLNTKSSTEAEEEMAATSEEQINEKEVEDYKSNTFTTLNTLKEIMPTLLEILEWYRLQKDSSTKVILAKLELNLNDPELSGNVSPHPIKCYDSIFIKFKEVCKQYPGYKQQDLISKALLEFINKYKK